MIKLYLVFFNKMIKSLVYIKKIDLQIFYLSICKYNIEEK
jgi:hypothetical protein